VNVDPNELEHVVRASIAEVAPDVDADSIERDADFHDDLGLDSMDSLNLAIELHDATGIDIPERDYSRITSIASCVDYLRRRGGG
jgi:acyl carrier protein